MHRLAISTAMVALVFGLPDAAAKPGAKADSKPAAGQAQATPHSAGRRARTSLPVSRERRAFPLVHRREPLTAEDRLAHDIESIWSGRWLRRGTTAVYVVDAATGEPLYAIHENERLNPASNVKLIATATILDVLGPAFRYHTRLLGPAPQGDAITGDLYLLGSYDPTFGQNDVRAMAADLAASGVRRVNGDIYVGKADPQSELVRDSVAWPRFSIGVRGAARAGEPAEVTVTPATGFVHLESQVKTVKRGKPRIKIALEPVTAEGVTTLRVVVSGTIGSRRRATYRRDVAAGQLFTGHLLAAALAEAGVTVTGTVKEARLFDYVTRAAAYSPVELVSHASRSMAELIAVINKRSVNYLADRTVMTAGAARYGGAPTMEKAVRAMHEWLNENAGVDPQKLVLDTGSGLSYNTELTARQMVRVLRAAGGFAQGSAADLDPEHGEDAPHDRPGQIERAFVASLAVGGEDGTLRGRFRKSATRGKVLGKTGTLTRVIALSGIVRDDDGDALAFSIITNGHHHKNRGTVRKQHEAMVEAMQRYLEQRQRSEPALTATE